jgi:hypothetical protein
MHDAKEIMETVYSFSATFDEHALKNGLENEVHENL